MSRILRWLMVVVLSLVPAPARATSYLVGNLNDSGPGSFREALDLANADGEPSSIGFAPGLAGQSIDLAALLPALSEPQTSIDGDFGADCTPDIGIRGGAVGPGGPGLRLDGGGHVVHGLAISGFIHDATIRIHSDNNTVRCNRIGINLAGGGPTSFDAGVAIVGANGNQIGPGNVIENNGSAGVRVTEFSLPGFPEMAGFSPDLVLTFNPIAFDDTDLGLRNAGGPLLLDQLGRPFTENFVLRLRGTLSVSQAGSYSFTANPLDDQLRVRVGTETVIEGNGPGPLNGSITLSAGTHAFELEFAEYGGYGALTLATSGPGSASFNTDGQALCPSGLPGLCGELFQMRVPAERNRITANRIANNGATGISLSCCEGPLPNDPGDIDIGANTWINRPQLTAVLPAGGGNYSLSGSAPPNATIEVFEAVVDPGGSGEAGSLRASFSAAGDGSFNAPIVLPATPGVLTATATDALGNSSEFSVNLPYGGSDVVTVGNAAGVVAGAATSIPIHVRDLALTPLGVDRGSGERIQGLALRIDFPVGAVSTASIAPAGITAALTPAFGPLSNFSPGSVTYLVAYNEASNSIPFDLGAAAPGDQVAILHLTVHPGQSPGSFALTLNAATELSNQAGTLTENSANGALSLLAGSVQATSNAPGGLHAQSLSSSSIRLRWIDAQQVETGYRVQRSSDGSTYGDVQDLGADAGEYTDNGLAPGSLYYYRVRTLVGAVVGGASNRATATTFPAAPALVCVDPQTISRRWARSPDITHRGTEWGLVYHARDDGTREQVFFQRLHDLTLAPQAPRVQISNSATGATFPGLAWNGTHYGVTWVEALRGAAGGPLASGLRFSLLDADGNLLRGPRRLDALPLANLNFNEILRPHWDGSHWGVFLSQFEVPFRRSIAFRRLDADGDSVLGPVDVIASTTHQVFNFDAAWQPLSSEYGMLWVSARDGISELQFRRIEESSGVALGSVTVLTSASAALLAGTSLAADPAGGWLAAWSECPPSSGCSVWARRLTASGLAAGPGVRVSGPDPASDARPRLARRSGGWYLYTEAIVSNNPEIYRFLLDAGGASDGLPGTAISALDARASGRPRAASDGSRSLVAWSESPSTLEVAGRISEASGTLGAQATFTSGHGPANTAAVVVPDQPRAVALGGGFVSLWRETSTVPNTLNGRLYGADGSLLADYAPLSATAASGRPGLAGVGSSWAVAWRVPGGSLRFARYFGDGSVAVPETTLATGVGQGNVELAWDGEGFAAFYPSGAFLRMLRVAIDGTPIGAPVVLGLAATSGIVRVVWLGDSWAVLWRDAANGDLLYGRVGPDGSLLQAAVEFAPTPVGSDFDISAGYDGSELGVAWSASFGVDPPTNALYFTVLNRDGGQAFPQASLLPAASAVSSPQLHHDGQRWRVIYQADNENTAGMRELTLERTPGGVAVAGSRFLANRGSTSAASAHDGAALALSWRSPFSNDIHVETDACLADPSPPPCPVLALASVGGNVRASWSSVADPQSGIWRQHLYRDGRVLAELPADALQFDDSGYEGAAIHAYQVRAMNRAFQESAACPTASFSTTVGDANGNGTLEVADIFYLINFLLANGPPPAGDADANGDGAVSVGDIFFIINYFFSGGPLPTAIDGGAHAASG